MTIKHKKDTKFEFVYFIDAIAYYASVQEARKKFKSDEKEYAMTLFITPEDAKEARLPIAKGGLFINKKFNTVDVDRKEDDELKYDSEKYPGTEGLVGIQLTAPELTKQGKKRKLTIIDKDGNPFEDLIGNGSKVTVKCWGWRKSAEDKLNITLELVQVKELVPYEGATNGAVEDEILGVSYQIPQAKESKKSDDGMDFDDSDVPFDVEDDSDSDLY